MQYIIRYQSRDVIYPVLKGSGFVKRWGVSRTAYQNHCPLKRDILSLFIWCSCGKYNFEWLKYLLLALPGSRAVYFTRHRKSIIALTYCLCCVFLVTFFQIYTYLCFSYNKDILINDIYVISACTWTYILNTRDVLVSCPCVRTIFYDVFLPTFYEVYI
jgi:hypothetical protein